MMVISPTGVPSLSQSGSESVLGMKPTSRKRKLPGGVMADPVKESILQYEVAKLEVLNRIN